MPVLIRVLRDGSIKKVHYGGSVEYARASHNMRDYFDKQDKGKINGGEIRCAGDSTHRFNR